MKTTKNQMEMYEKYQKNRKKLVLTGGNENTWFWRDGEIQMAQFTKLSNEEKKTHLKFLLKLQPKNRSTNDEYIIRFYGPKETNKENKFFTLEDENMPPIAKVELLVEEIKPSSTNEICEEVDEELTEEQINSISQMTKQDMRKVLATFFSDYNFWEVDYRNQTPEQFITNTGGEFAYDAYHIEVLTQFKNLK